MSAAKKIRHALVEALAMDDDAPPPEADVSTETVDVDGAARLLHTTVQAIYQRRHAGQMPTPLSRRPLVWRKADLLTMPKR